MTTVSKIIFNNKDGSQRVVNVSPLFMTNEKNKKLTEAELDSKLNSMMIDFNAESYTAF